MGKRFATTMPGSRPRTGGMCSRSRRPSRHDIRAHLERENAYAAAALEDMEELRERLVAEMRGRIKEDDSTVPEPEGPFAYYTRYREGGQHPLVCRQPRGGGPEEILLDGDKEGEGFPFFDLGDARKLPRPPLLAWSADRKGSEYFTVRIRDLATGERPSRRRSRPRPTRSSGLGDSRSLYLRRA